jgi:hypothetical protein
MTFTIRKPQADVTPEEGAIVLYGRSDRKPMKIK